MNKLGILAYGSLIGNPGEEIQNAVAKCIEFVETPFKVEFARSSHGRCGAPTLVPVKQGGAHVKAAILVLEEHISVEEAESMLWRREANQINRKRTYNPPTKPGPDTVYIERLKKFYNTQTVLYARIPSNIKNLTPQRLAELATTSARCEAGTQERDGISYLIAAKRNGIITPLMFEYEKEILQQTKTKNLEEALRLLSTGNG